MAQSAAAEFGYSCAVVLAVVFVRAGAAKLARPKPTAAGFAALGLPAATTLAQAVPAIELAIATALVALPRAGAVAALVALAAFSAVVARAVRSGSGAGCNCFGSARLEPVSAADLVRNGLLGLLATSAALTTRPLTPRPLAVAGAAMAFGAGAWLARKLRPVWRRPHYE